MKGQRSGFLTGLVVGLLIGLGVALALALYITKAPVPFINKLPQRTAEQDAAEAQRNRNWDPNAALAGKNPARSASAAASGAFAAPPETARAGASAPSATAARSARDPAAILAGQVPAAASRAAVAGFDYWVQIGAYARSEDAEAQRARLGMLGQSAKVLEREQSGRTVYRVRIGPFEGRAEAEDIQDKLAAAGFEANLVRVEH